jgi:tetratricopeptide (TPR) repeat protein
MIHALLWVSLLLQTQTAAPAVPPVAASLLQSGVQAENSNDLDSAIGAFRKAADLAPSSAIVFFRLGDAYMRKGDYVDAIPPLKHAAELNPDAPAIQQSLGFALLAAGYASEAIPHFARINEVGALGIAQLQSGSPADAVANLRAALAKTPNDPDLLFYLGRASAQLSSQSLDNLLSSFPDSPRAHQAKGQSFFQQKMYAEAEKEYQQALALRPDLPGLRLELGQIYEAQSDWPKAEKEFRHEAETQPGNGEAAYRLGDVLLQEGKMKEAAEELQRSNTIRPDMADTLYSLGRATAASDPTTAERALIRVTELEKQTSLAAQAYLALAGVHRKLGKSEQASRDMQDYRHIQASIVVAPYDPKQSQY